VLTWIGVLGVHAALIVLFLRLGSHRATAPYPDSEPPIGVILLERPPPKPVLAPLAPSTTARVHSPTRSHQTHQPADTPLSLPTAPPSPSHPVDWYHEAELAGARQALATPLSSGLRGPGAGSRVCKTRPEAHWEPQPKRVGLAGGLIPYVRIGPCAVGLAIFGCAFGRSPANGHLLDAARDHDSDALDGPDCAP
jgi:hypothetical protein